MKKVLVTTGILTTIALVVTVGYFFVVFKAVSVPRSVSPSGETTVSTSATSTSTTSASSTSSPVSTIQSLADFKLPEGFAMTVFAEGVINARVMTFDPRGTMLVSQPSQGKIVALPDLNSDGKADKKITVAENLSRPHGMAFICRDVAAPDKCDFYIAETNTLSLFEYNPETNKAVRKKKLLDLPTDGYNQHYTRSLTVLPAPDQDTILVSAGSACNVCDERDERRAKILFYNTVTGETGEYARGLRNAVFSTLHPVTGEVWATEMGRDGLGDDIPPDEINIVKKDSNYGWPICYGKNIHDTDFDKKTYIRNPCQEPMEKASHIDLQAHSAPLGLAFVPEEGWNEQYWHDLLVAYHGSWNRSIPTGYKIVRIKFSDRGEYQGTEDFITGWLKSDGTKIGRPVDIKILPGGTMYISDDGAGIIYRVIVK